MTTGEDGQETTVSDSGMVTIPAAVRERLDVGPGDKLRWSVTDDGDLAVAVVHQREGVFDDFEAVDAGETDAVAVESAFGAE